MIFFDFLSNPPYRMVIMSFISLILFLVILLFIRIIYPKKKIPYPVLLLGFAILPTLSIFREGTYESGDLTIHVSRLMAFYKNLEEGVLIPKWAGGLNATYGYGVFIFYYPLAYYLASIFHFLGFTYLDSVKLLLTTTYITSGFAFYFFLRNSFKNKFAFLGSIFYLFAPYHLVDMHFRATIGEMTAFLLLPLTFLAVDKAFQKITFFRLFMVGLITAFLILSHPAIALVGFGILFLYIFIRPAIGGNKRFLLIGPVLGLFFASFYWIPALIEGLYTHQRFDPTNLAFPRFTELLYSKWRWGLLFQGPQGQLSYLIGYAHLLVLIVATILIFKLKKTKFAFFYFLSLGFIFLLLEISKPIWLYLPLLKNMLLPYRLLLFIAFTTSVISAFIAKYIKSDLLYYLLFILVVGSTILNWGNRKNLPNIKDEQIRSNLPYITYQAEGAWNAVIKARPFDDLWQSEVPKSHIESLNRNIEIIQEVRNTVKHTYIIKVEGETRVKENTYYYPGWNLYVDGEKSDIKYQSSDYPGIITFDLRRGIHNIDLQFEDTLVRKLSFTLSSISLIISGIYLLISRGKILIK